jgi:AraC-like DNA-binding protein
VAIMGLNYSLISAGREDNWLILLNDIMWEYLFPVTLLLYFLYALEHPFSRDKRQYYLYLPFLVTLIINVIIDLDIDFEIYHWDIIHNENVIETYYFFEDIGSVLFAIVLTYQSWKVLQKYPSPVPSQWLWHFWLWSTATILVWIVLWILDEAIGLNYTGQIFNVVCLFFFWVTFRGVFQFKLAEEKFEIRKILATETVRPDNRLIADHPLFIRLEQLMQEEHLYRDPELNRDSLAQKLGISSGYLSQRINQDSGLNFSEYVNAYRVAEVKRLLLDPKFEPYSLLAIGYEAGFNSKSTFYAAFKKETGLSPSAYKQQKPEENRN